MNIHEYQAKEILMKYGIPIPDFGVASNDKEVQEVIEALNLTSAVIKIQVHAGGRGKGEGSNLPNLPKKSSRLQVS